VIADLPLRWLVTGMFLLSGVGFTLVTDRRSMTSVVSHGLHLVMVIAMAVMAWPQGLRLPATPTEVFFLAAALWFVMTAVVIARMVAQRVAHVYQAVMMFAMAWMYAVAHQHPPDQRVAEHHHHHMLPGVPMPDMDMDMTATDAHPGDTMPGWVDAGNWIWTIVFVVAALVWGYRFATRRGTRRSRRNRSWRRTLGSAVQMLLAVAMAIMFATLLFDQSGAEWGEAREFPALVGR
jgi:hypothetical protein